MLRALDAESAQTCRRLIACCALLPLWAAALSPHAVWSGVALLAGGCAMVAAAMALLRGERPFAPSLNRWDEAATLLALHALARLLD
jgi:hypothetical protein